MDLLGFAAEVIRKPLGNIGGRVGVHRPCYEQGRCANLAQVFVIVNAAVSGLRLSRADPLTVLDQQWDQRILDQVHHAPAQRAHRDILRVQQRFDEGLERPEAKRPPQPCRELAHPFVSHDACWLKEPKQPEEETQVSHSLEPRRRSHANNRSNWRLRLKPEITENDNATCAVTNPVDRGPFYYVRDFVNEGRHIVLNHIVQVPVRLLFVEWAWVAAHARTPIFDSPGVESAVTQVMCQGGVAAEVVQIAIHGETVTHEHRFAVGGPAFRTIAM